jgi:hypothetical protein
MMLATGLLESWWKDGWDAVSLVCLGVLSSDAFWPRGGSARAFQAVASAANGCAC